MGKETFVYPQNDLSKINSKMQNGQGGSLFRDLEQIMMIESDI